MFTLKFIRHGDEGDTTTVLSCNHYSVWSFNKNNEYIEVTVHKVQASDEGIVFRVGKSDVLSVYDVCFVENINGKTIDRIAM